MTNTTRTSRLRSDAEQLITACDRLDAWEAAVADGTYDYDALGDAALKRADRERYVDEVAASLGNLLGNATNGGPLDGEKLIERGLTREHPTLIANVLRAVLGACRAHSGDGRIPEWAQSDQPVPFI